MNNANKAKAGWKQAVVSEMIEYWLIAAYLACYFSLFTWYRRLILAEYQISYANYGVSLLEALVLAKLILIGSALRLDRGLEDAPLIIPTLYKAGVFSLLVGVFSILEHTLGGLLHGQGLTGGVAELINVGKYELLARCLVTFFAFIPFFACKELEQVLGEGKIVALLFRGEQ